MMFFSEGVCSRSWGSEQAELSYGNSRSTSRYTRWRNMTDAGFSCLFLCTSFNYDLCVNAEDLLTYRKEIIKIESK
jgi:hypothetical protein